MRGAPGHRLLKKPEQPFCRQQMILEKPEPTLLSTRHFRSSLALSPPLGFNCPCLSARPWTVFWLATDLQPYAADGNL